MSDRAPRRLVLQRPPIAEVVCGFVFPPVAGLDALNFGVYWSRRVNDFPTKALQPALLQDSQLFLDQPLVRAWLVSADDAFVLQLQADRFYMNWRQKGGVYPRFSDHGDQRGLLSQALVEFERFRDFCATHVGQEPIVSRIELSKIDLLVQGRDWADLADLARLVPVTSAFQRVRGSGPGDMALRFSQKTETGTLRVNVTTARTAENATPALQIDTQHATPISARDQIEGQFKAANSAVNDVFFSLLNEDELARFGIGGDDA